MEMGGLLKELLNGECALGYEFLVICSGVGVFEDAYSFLEEGVILENGGLYYL